MKKAHELGIIHRDLKPDNIFLVRNDDQEIAKVLDFGIAKAQHPFGDWAGGTRTGALIGTLQYMSPEQAQGHKLDSSSDLWALGVIAFECVCGRLPFPSDKPGELIVQICARPIPVPSEIARVPPRFDAWFARACQRDPQARFSSAKELADTLTEVLAATSSASVLVPRAAAPPPSGPTGTQLPLGSPPDAPAASTPATDVPRASEPPGDGRTSGSINGGAVVDSDPSTLLRNLPSRARKAMIAAVASAAVIGGLAIWWTLGGEPAGGPPSTETGTGARGTEPQVTPRSDVEPPQLAPSAVTAEPSVTRSEPAPSASAASSSPTAKPTASTGAKWRGVDPSRSAAPKASASASASASVAASASAKKPDRIGW
jgi:serine/threonine protein kinase